MRGILVGLLILICSSCGVRSQEVGEGAVKNLSEASAINTQLGLAYLKRGNTARAKKKLLLAIEQAPKSVNTVLAMAYFFEKTDQPNKAGVFYQRALKIDSHQGVALNNYGAYLCRQKHYRQADKYFMQAIKDPRYVDVAEAWENAGLCAQQAGNKIKAAEYFRIAVSRDPKRSKALFHLGELAMAGGDIIGARQYMAQYKQLQQQVAS